MVPSAAKQANSTYDSQRRPLDCLDLTAVITRSWLHGSLKEYVGVIIWSSLTLKRPYQDLLSAMHKLSILSQNPTLTLRKQEAALFREFQFWVPFLISFCSFGVQFWGPNQGLQPPPSCLGVLFFWGPVFKVVAWSQLTALNSPWRHSAVSF